ncbi:m7GpppN-mRNA hydrolase [Acropora cervicornis]|uniref:M7GpppN-mRNA hydrolase n=1 Tax=Acropora cervicornis TaxID=6130 RepID=A0AAD9QDG6_ACRCE|nr:m7GpppN-mRNA hydrolase [Acropora cervicornis]
MASDLEIDVESDSPFFPSSSIVPKTVLEDLCSRFLINIPEEERRDIVRLCFQIETAHWFYFPFLNKSRENIDEVFENWKKYKYSVPVYGAIMLNQNLDKVLEETGFDITHFADPDQYLEHNFQDHQVRLYIVPGVPEKTVFRPQTRGEIKNINWFQINHLPSHKKDTVTRENLRLNPSAFFMVIPFVKNLKKWISAARQPEVHPPESRSMEPQGNKQLNKLLAKEEQRLEQEQKRASVERRRKQQQEQFQLQHELNHPLRQHHAQNAKTLREQSYLETCLNPLQQMNSGQLMYAAIMAHRPVPMPQGNIYPHHPHMGSQVFTEVSQGQISGGGTPPSTNPTSHSKQRPATPLEQSWEDNEFQFSSPAFLNFKFDPKPILACLPT